LLVPPHFGGGHRLKRVEQCLIMRADLAGGIKHLVIGLIQLVSLKWRRLEKRRGAAMETSYCNSAPKAGA
jgi:hypothetical protein